MGEPLFTANADILHLPQAAQANPPQWTAGVPNDLSGNGGSVVVYLTEYNNSFRLITVRLNDQSVLLEQLITAELSSKFREPNMFQWRTANKQDYCLIFLHVEEARIFKDNIERLKQYLKSNPSNGVYQDPQVCYPRDVDQESIGSGHSAAVNSGHSTAVGSYRQHQQKSSYSSIQNSQAGTLTQQQRRCSQGSSGSSGTSSSNIYATAQHVNNNGYHPSSTNGPLPAPNGIPPVKSTGAPPPPPPPPPPPQLLNGTAPSSSAANIAPVSKSIPPPPPLPASLADQLKNASLRKTSNAITNTNPSASAKTSVSEAPPPTPKTSGPPNFLEELSRKFSSRNNGKTNTGDNISNSSSSGVSSSSITSSSDTSDSGATIVVSKKPGDQTSTTAPPKTWPKSNGVMSAGITAAMAAANGTLDSPKGQRKVINGTSSETTTTSGITVADLERFKQEILMEVNKTKQDLAEMKTEMTRMAKIQQDILETLLAGLKR